jgi:hypothetical protein
MTPCAAVRAAIGAEKGAEFLRRWELPIVARVEGGAIILDPRTVSPADDGVVEAALTALGSKSPS